MMTAGQKIAVIGGAIGLSLLISKKARANNEGEANDPSDTKRKEFEKYVAKVISFEGGYTNDPDDLGGKTKFGITSMDTDLDIESLTYSQAVEIYYNVYWLRYKCYAMSKQIRFLYFDSCVTPGQNWAIRTIQTLGGVTVDGVIGAKTIAASANVSPEDWSNARIDKYYEKAAERVKNQKYLQGWINRTKNSYNYQISLK